MSNSSPNPSADRRVDGALRIAANYLLVGLLWVLLTDRLVSALISNSARLNQVNSFKGAIFVAFSALLFYFLVHREISRLRRSEERFQLAMNATRDGLWDWDIPTGSTYFSPAYFEMLGYPPGALPSGYQTWLELVHPDDRAAAYQVNMDCVENRIENFEIEFRMRAANGDWRWILGRGRAVHRDGNARATRLIGTHIDITERKRAEAAQVESEARYRLLAANMADVVWVLDPSTLSFRYVSPSVERLRGFTVEEVMAQSMDQVVCPDSLRVIQSLLSEGLQSFLDSDAATYSQVNEIEQWRKDGSTVWTEVVATLLKTPAGGIEVLGVSRDISARRKAEAALKEREARLQAVVESAGSSIWSVDRQYRLTMANTNLTKNVLADLGQPLHTGSTVLEDWMPAELRDVWRARYDRALTGETFQEVMTRRGADGSMLFREITFHPIVEPDAGVTGVACFGRDITEQHNFEIALQESERRFRQLADSMPQLVWTAQPDGKIDYFNQRRHEFAPLPTGMLSVEGWLTVLHPDDRLPTDVAWRQAVLTGEVYQVEHRALMANGTYRWHLSRGIPMLDAAGRVVKWFGTTTDIHDTKRAEEDLQQAAGELARSNAELEQFAYVASHDLQEPLRAVSSMLHLLREYYGTSLDARAEEFITHSVEGAERMQTLIDDLLAYSRVGTRGRPFEPTSLPDVFQDVLANLAASVRKTSARITSDPLPSIVADPTQMGQLFQNLIANAVKFHGSQPPEIHVGARQLSREWLFSISDNGIGIDPQFSDRIFAVFQRLHTRREYPGTGIGLAICKKIVERHGGRIWVESRPGFGSTFFFTLPIREELAV